MREELGSPSPRIVERYAIYGAIASGGMATVHVGRLVGVAGFSRPVAIKRLHAQYARDPEFSAMFLDEARVSARVRHPNVVSTLDVVSADGELFLVMEYVHGESFSSLLRAARAQGGRLPARIVCNIVAGALHGLHAAHEATREDGAPLGIVHRDVSPQNVLVGVDGIPRVLDFGVAKAAGKLHATRAGELQGKLRYMAPEQVLSEPLGSWTDIWAASVMLWEALTGAELFSGENDAAILHQVLYKTIPSPRDLDPAIPESLAALVLSGLERDPTKRVRSASWLAVKLEAEVGLVPTRELGDCVKHLADSALGARAKVVTDVETICGPVVLEKTQARPRRSPLVAAALVAAGLGIGATWFMARSSPDSGAALAASPVQPAPPPAPAPMEDLARPERPSEPAAETESAATASATAAPAPPGSVVRAPPRTFKVPLYGRD